MLKKLTSSILTLALLSGCTTNYNMYTGEEYDEFSLLNTIALPIAILGVMAIIDSNQQSSSSNYVYCRGSYCDKSAAWDYFPSNGEYRCRDTDNGQFVQNYYCSGQYKQDNWY